MLSGILAAILEGPLLTSQHLTEENYALIAVNALAAFGMYFMEAYIV